MIYNKNIIYIPLFYLYFIYIKLIIGFNLVLEVTLVFFY